MEKKEAKMVKLGKKTYQIFNKHFKTKQKQILSLSHQLPYFDER